MHNIQKPQMVPLPDPAGPNRYYYYRHADSRSRVWVRPIPRHQQENNGTQLDRSYSKSLISVLQNTYTGAPPITLALYTFPQPYTKLRTEPKPREPFFVPQRSTAAAWTSAASRRSSRLVGPRSWTPTTGPGPEGFSGQKTTQEHINNRVPDCSASVKHEGGI